MKFLLGKKVEMSQVFDEQGNVVPVSLIKAGPCYIAQIKTNDKDGYDAVQIGFEKIKASLAEASKGGKKKIKKTMNGKPYRFLRELRILKPETCNLKPNDEINVSIFQEGDKVNVSGISKGKGFAGSVKRWGFVDKAKAHGAKDMRRVGSIGARFPQRVIKGKKMPGRMGSERITVKNLEVIKIDKENNLLSVKGAIPGRRGTLLEVRSLTALKKQS